MNKLSIKIFILSLLLCRIIIAGDNIWTVDGPYNNSRVQAIAINPLNNNQVLLGTVEDGLYRSEDGGDNWAHIDSDILPTTIRTIRYHPFAPDTIFCATVGCLFRSNDNAVTWERVELPIGGYYDIYALAIHPVFPNIIFTTGPLLEWSCPNYKSVDGGRTWEIMSFNTDVAHNFIIDPLDDSTIYATTHSGEFRKSIFRSEDLGETWENIHCDLDTTLIVYGMVIDPADNNIMYLCGYNCNGGIECIYKSIDKAQSWTDITPSYLIYGMARDICISPLDHNTLFVCAAGDGVLRSIDAGESWTKINTGLAVWKTKTIICDEDTGVLYLGTYFDGAYRSMNNGESWEKISENMPNTYCTDLALNPSNPDDIYITSYFGLYKLASGENDWEFIDVLYPYYNHGINCLAIDQDESEHLFLGIGYSDEFSDSIGFKRSLDGGQTWEFFNEGYDIGADPKEIKIGSYGGNKVLFVATSEGLYLSEDYGESWNRNEDIPEIFLDAIAIYPDNNKILAGGLELYESNDSGQNWSQIAVPDNDYYINNIEYDPYNPDIFYITIFNDGLYKTTDGGESWDDISEDLPTYLGYMFIDGLAINPLNANNIFVTCGLYGVFQSHDGGESWDEYSEGLNTNFSEAQIAINPNDTCKIVLATNAQSVWTITRTATGIENDVASLPSSININAYPNPFNAATRITFNIGTASNVKADIYDVLGRHVANIVNEYLYPGYHSVVWKPEAISTGQYYLRLDDGNAISSQKMLYIK